MLSTKELADILLTEELEEIYESDRKILKHIDADLQDYLNEIDDHFLDDEKNNTYFNIGFLYSANCDSSIDIEKFYNMITELKDENLISLENHNNFLYGFEKHQNEFYKSPTESYSKSELAAFYVERALITKYCTDNINSLSA